MPDSRAGAFVEGGEVLVDLEGDDRLAVVGDLDLLDRAGLHARDLDEVALHQLGGVDELGLDGVAAAPAGEQQDGDNDHGDGHGQNSRDASCNAHRSHSALKLLPGPPTPLAAARTLLRRRQARQSTEKPAAFALLAIRGGERLLSRC
jgi:hypothetical protein